MRETSQIITRLGERSVAFRCDGRVTVPGKGGRPRKWLSDADRVRAYRARQRGDSEPPTHADSFSGHDALATELQRNLRLEAMLNSAHGEAARLRRDLVAAELSIDRLEERVAQLQRQRADLLNQVADSNQRLLRPSERTVDVREPPGPVANRAARRRANRQRQN